MIEFLVGLTAIVTPIAIIIGISYLIGKYITRDEPFMNWEYRATIGFLILAATLVLIFGGIMLLFLSYELGYHILTE